MALSLDTPLKPKTTPESSPAGEALTADAFLDTVQDRLAQLWHRLTDLTQAWRGWRTTHQALSEHTLADANVMLGNGYLQAGKYGEAIEALTNAIRHDPTFAKAYFLLGMARSCRGEHGAAIGHYSQAIALRPDKAGYYFCRGRSYEALRQAQHALEDYARVLLLEPEHHGAHACYRHIDQVCQGRQNS